MLEHDLAALSDPAKDQYFLTNPVKLQVILEAADIRESDSVVEIGAGVGTVACVLPKCASLTLIELDERLIPALRRNAPDYATILNTDGLAFLRNENLRASVILGNLPNQAARDLAVLLPKLSFRTAIVTAESAEPFEALSAYLECLILTTIQGADFTPSQPGTSYLVQVRPKRRESLLGGGLPEPRAPDFSI